MCHPEQREGSVHIHFMQTDSSLHYVPFRMTRMREFVIGNNVKKDKPYELPLKDVSSYRGKM